MRFEKTVMTDTGKNELTIDNIVKYMDEVDLSHKDILLAQIYHETGNLDKITYKNNLFGFKAKNYLTFETWQDCIDYMKKWQDKHWGKYNINGDKDYYSFLVHKKYAEDKNYILRLKKIVKQYEYVRK